MGIAKSENSKENYKNLINSPISDIEESNKRQSNNSHSSSEENVNVKERASIFGPRKFSETKVRTVSAPSPAKLGTEGTTSTNVTKQNKFNSQSSNQTSPSKIKNMA